MQKFTKFLDDVAQLRCYCAQIDHDIAIRFLALVQQMHVVSVSIDNIFAILFGCHSNVS